MLSVLSSTTWFIRLCRRHRCCFPAPASDFSFAASAATVFAGKLQLPVMGNAAKGKFW